MDGSPTLNRDGLNVARRLEALTARQPDLAEAIAYYAHLLPRLHAATLELAIAGLNRESAQRKLASGTPLLLGEQLEFDPLAARDFFLNLCEITGEYTLDEQKRVAVECIRVAALSGEIGLIHLLGAAGSGQTWVVPETASRLGLDASLLALLVQNTLKPPLRAFQRRYQEQVDLEGWRRCICPFCGRAPALAELQGAQRAGHLRCGICAGDWPYPRLQCGLCENDDYRTLGTFGLEDEQNTAFAQACECCRGYLKTVVTFEPTPVHLIEIQDLETISLDWTAAILGYTRPAWG